MSEVYYRKWRPRRLDQVVGQEPVTQTLRQAVSLGRVAHAYLFCGPRGTGKTSTARILAKAVNCSSPENGEPDNLCEMCRAVDEGHALDVIEIDAASNRGIDDIRNLNDKIHFTPNKGRYKVYIIDEVHMLTTEAFNALLKTLEEPPEHAILILATTEAHKVPLTVISRCQRFDFRRISIEQIVGKLMELCQGEGIEVDGEALALIARTAGGSLRDAENLMEQSVVSYGSPVSEEQVRGLLGLGGDEMALDLVHHVLNKATGEGLTLINQVVGQGHDLRQLHRGVLEYLRGALLLKTKAGSALGYSEETRAILTSLAESTAMEHLVRALKTFARADMRRDSSSPLPLELALVEVSTDVPVVVADARPPVAANLPTSTRADRTASRPEAPRQPAAPQSRQRSSPPSSPPPSPPQDANPRRDARSDEPVVVPSEPAARLEHQWNGILRELRQTGARFKLGALLRGCSERVVADGLITLLFRHASHVERMQSELDDPQTRKKLEEAFASFMDGQYEVKVSLAGDGNGSSSGGVAQKSQLVRAAQAMGARVVGEKEDETDDEQEDATPSPAAAAAYGEDPGRA